MMSLRAIDQVFKDELTPRPKAYFYNLGPAYYYRYMQVVSSPTNRMTTDYDEMIDKAMNLIAIEDPEEQAADHLVSNVQSLGIERKSSPIRAIPAKHYEVDNTTATQEVTPKIRQEIETMFMTDREEIFEDGMESVFSKAFTSAIRTYGNPIIEILSGLMNDDKVNSEVAAEAMRWLGHIDDPPTYDKRLWLLERSLQNPSARVRDGAALGIASLNDPDAIPYLKKAIEAEECEELREDMKQVLLELEMEHQCPLS